MVKLRKEEELHPLERSSLIDMSYSRMNTYEMCPQKYFHTYIEKRERQFGPAAVLGNILHSVLEDYVGEDLDLDLMVESVGEYRKKYDPDGLIDDSLMNDGYIMLEEFVARHQGETFDVIEKEMPFSVIVGSARIRGFIDLVIKSPNGGVYVIDWKTGKHEVSNKNTPNDLQLGVYALALSQRFEDQDIHAELYYLRSGRRKGHSFIPGDLDKVYDIVLDKVNTIINDRFFHPTNERWPCSFCDFRKDGSCRTGIYRFGKD